MKLFSIEQLRAGLAGLQADVGLLEGVQDDAIARHRKLAQGKSEFREDVLLDRAEKIRTELSPKAEEIASRIEQNSANFLAQKPFWKREILIGRSRLYPAPRSAGRQLENMFLSDDETALRSALVTTISQNAELLEHMGRLRWLAEIPRLSRPGLLALLAMVKNTNDAALLHVFQCAIADPVFPAGDREYFRTQISAAASEISMPDADEAEKIFGEIGISAFRAREIFALMAKPSDSTNFYQRVEAFLAKQAKVSTFTKIGQ